MLLAILDPSLCFTVDCNGHGNSFVITLIGMSIVFVSLLLIYLVFNNLGKFLKYRKQAKRAKENEGTGQDDEQEAVGEVNAAIAMALHLYYSEAHDFENTVLTIQKVSKTYSPWSSKIYGLRYHPRHL